MLLGSLAGQPYLFFYTFLKDLEPAQELVGQLYFTP